MFSLLCRVCLVRDTRFHNIENTLLQTMFEKLSGSKLITADGRSKLVCYLCHTHLRRCWRLQEMSQNTEYILTQLHHGDLQLAQDKIPLVNVRSHNLSISTIKCASIPDYVKNENPEIFIKEEMTLKTFSVEVQTEDDPAIETPLEFDFMTSMHTVKQEHSSEFEDNFLDVDLSYLSIPSQIQPEETNNTENTTSSRKVKGLTIKSSDAMSDDLKPYSCVTCSKQFKQNANLRKHMKSHNDPKLFSCNKCIETFNNKCDFDKHYLLHSQEKLPCDLCGNSFFSKYSLKIHIRHKHRRAKSYICDICNKSFNHRGTLHLHMRTHTGDKPHACDKCSKRFSQKGTLLRHIRMHTGEKPYACDKCTKTFNQESSLKRHIKMHNGVKPYTCSKCGKAYYESSHLTRHLRTHTGEKPYACDRCFQTFSQSSNLQSHMKKHTGETPSNYICHECNKAFDHKSIFKRHILKHTREKPYPCNRCDKKYADKRTLKRHIATHDQN